MHIQRLRIMAISALVPAALALWGCQELTTSPGGNPGGTTDTGSPQEISAIQQVVDSEDYTAPAPSNPTWK